MTEHPPPNALVVLKASVNHDDPGEIVGSNVWFVSALLEEHLTADEITSDALRSYYVDYYLAQVNNGGFSQFVYNSRWSPLVVLLVRQGLKVMGAKRHLEVFDGGARLVEAFGQDRLDEYFASEYFGDNADRDELNAPNDEFMAVEETEGLLALNAVWLRSHRALYPVSSEGEMLKEARRRGQALPDRERREAEVRANEPRYMKLIRALCDRSGQELERVTAGDPTRVHEGQRTLAWHFITNMGHHHMVEAGAKVIMFRGHSTTDRVCEIDAPPDE